MALMAGIVTILIGAPILLTISALCMMVPFILLGTTGSILVRLYRFVKKSTKANRRNFSPNIRFRLRQTSQAWNRNVRAT